VPLSRASGATPTNAATGLRLSASGGFQHDEAGLQGPQPFESPSDAGRVVGRGPRRWPGTRGDNELGLGDVDANKWSTEHGTSQRSMGRYKADELSRGLEARVNELPRARSSLESGRTARASSLARVLIYAGAAGTLILALNGARLVLGPLWQRGALSELIPIVPLWALVGTWILSPYWGALRLQRGWSTTPGQGAVVVIVALVVIALGANSFLATSAFVGGKPHPTADGVTIVLIPIVQWGALGAAGLLLRLGRWSRQRIWKRA
jgi:hypothetical protein